MTAVAQKIISIVLAVFLFLTSGVSFKDKSDTAALPVLETSKERISLIDRRILKDEEYTMISTLQGIIAQKKAEIFITDGSNEILLEKGFENAEKKTYTDPWKLVEDYKDQLNDFGCVIFESGKNETVNMASTVAGVEKWLAVPDTQKDEAQKAGLKIMMDLTEPKKDGKKVTKEDIFEKYKNKLNRNLVVHQSYELITLRDYAVATKAFCFYTDEENKRDLLFRKKVFSFLKVNAPVFGWSSDEIGFVKQASENGLYVLPSDHCSNLSFLSGLKTNEPLAQKRTIEKITLEKDKHYIAFIMSDGDNVQWYETSLLYRGHFKDRVTTNESYKLTWTAPPLLPELAPEVLSRIYSEGGENNAFICGVSGMGYINPTNYPQRYLKTFVSESVKAAEKADLKVFATLDNTTSKLKLKNAMKVYAEESYLPGGFMQVGNRYEELEGKIIWSEGKPFISARKSFWYEGEDPDEKATKEYIEAFAKEINALKADNTSEDGYSYINIHPWSTTINDLNYLVSLLDEHIEIVFAEELLEMIKENVKH